MAEILGSLGLFLFCMHVLDGLEPLGALLQSVWGGKVRDLKKENRRLRREIAQLQQENTKQLDARVETLEDIVTSDEHELNNKLNAFNKK